MKGKLLKEILKEYEDIRLQEQEELKQREREVMSALPELAELRNSLVSSLAQKARSLILNPDLNPDHEQDENLVEEIKRKEAGILAKNGYPRITWLPLQVPCLPDTDTWEFG